ncbi:hypothetical protein [Cellulomonas massiliensis]|uniref:hypothetical protein n=1 Tax=Cellulomonas massiliensis TaxID=1465811 RepID=UPI0002D66A89|nr:hypothetical protein [Cellulomonas massiliensis]
MSRHLGAAAVAVLGVLAVAAGCTQDVGASDRSGGDHEVVLHLATAEEPDRPGTAIVDRFVAAVEASGAPVRIEVTPSIGGDEPAWDQSAIDALSDGYELALVPARAWRSRDVASLDALQLPTLVESDEQADAVAQDDALVAQLLDGLSAAGATGLGLYPESLRGVAVLDADEPLTDSTLDGLRVRAPMAPTVWATLEALGGTPVDLTTFDPGPGADQVQAVESQLSLVPGLPGAPWGFTADLPLYYKFQVLAASSDAWSRLDAPVRDALTAAAATALEATLAERPHAAEFVDDACDAGVHVLAAGADGAAVRDTFASLVAAAELDGATAELVAAVRAAAGRSEATPATCGDAQQAAWEDVPARPGGIPDGTYRVTVDADVLRAGGWPEHDIAHNVGTYTFVLDGGRYTWAQHADGEVPGPTHGGATYAVDGDRVRWAWGPELGGFVTETTWELQDDGSLVFAPDPGVPGNGGHSHIQLAPLVRIG